MLVKDAHGSFISSGLAASRRTQLRTSERKNRIEYANRAEVRATAPPAQLMPWQASEAQQLAANCAPIEANIVAMTKREKRAKR